MNNIHKNVTRNTRLLQTTIDLILCGSDNPKNTEKIIGFIDKVVTTTYEGTAGKKIVGKTSAKEKVATEIMAKGRAWDTTLQFNDEVTLQYFSNEECVETIKLRHSKNSWLVYEIGRACD